MILSYIIETPGKFRPDQHEQFIELLIEQGQVSMPSVEKLLRSKLLCMVYARKLPIAIGAIKNVYRTPFTKANVPDLAKSFDAELGYLYVSNSQGKEFQGLGIGKSICRLLLRELGSENVFATTAVGAAANNMPHILISLGFVKTGDTYAGGKTQKQLGLFLRFMKE